MSHFCECDGSCIWEPHPGKPCAVDTVLRYCDPCYTDMKRKAPKLENPVVEHRRAENKEKEEAMEEWKSEKLPEPKVYIKKRDQGLAPKEAPVVKTDARSTEADATSNFTNSGATRSAPIANYSSLSASEPAFLPPKPEPLYIVQEETVLSGPFGYEEALKFARENAMYGDKADMGTGHPPINVYRLVPIGKGEARTETKYTFTKIPQRVRRAKK